MKFLSLLFVGVTLAVFEDDVLEDDDEVTTTICGCACTSDALSVMAGDHSCGDRINWLQEYQGFTEYDACLLVAKTEFPYLCGPCDPTLTCDDDDDDDDSNDEDGDDTMDCGCPSTCTADVLNQLAVDEDGSYSCGGRIRWLLQEGHHDKEEDACLQVALEFPNNLCGPACNPLRCEQQLPTGSPTKIPTESPTKSPTNSPTKSPTNPPTKSPTRFPTISPTINPTTTSPTKNPTTRSPTTTETPPPYYRCNCPSCTHDILNRLATDDAGTFTCGARIDYLLQNGYPDEEWACKQVSNVEFPNGVCGPECDPMLCNNDTPPPTPNDDDDDYFCGCASCTQTVLNTLAGDFTCGNRMAWLRNNRGYSDQQACIKIADDEYPVECGACNPLHCNPELIDDPDPSDLIWSDEFNGQEDGSAPDSSKWGYDIGGNGWGNGEAQFYTDRRENSYVTNGILHIRAVRERYNNNDYTSARLVSRNKGDWTYGRFRVRARLQQCTATGTWPAIWMLPTDWVYGNWPRSGEIDIMEHVGYDTGKVHGTVHTDAFNHMIGTQRGGSTQTDVTQWHVYDVIWSDSKVEFLIDGRKYYEFERDTSENASYREWPFDQRFHLILNVAVGGSWGGARGIDSSKFEGNGQIMEIDWVRVYRNRESSPISAPTPPPVPLPSNEVEIKVMSYNTEYTGYYDGRIGSFGAKMRNVGADVVGVQECQIPDALASASGYTLVGGTGNQNYIFYKANRLRVIDSGWSSIPRDNYAPRTFTWAVFEVVGSTYRFLFFNTHLPHRHGQASDPNTHSRIGQSLLTKRNEIGDMPTVVVCDCNPFASDGASNGSFEDSLDAADISRLYIARGNPGFGGLDKIFASSNDWIGSDGSDEGTGSSDHPAIAINLTSK